MNIVFTAKGNNWASQIDPRFGRTEFLLTLEEGNDDLKVFDNRAADELAHGVGPKTVETLLDLGANVLITGNGPGNNAALILKKTGVKTFVGAGNMTVKEAYEAYKKNELEEFEY